MRRKKMVTYSKIPISRNTHSTHVGKWRIHYQNGDLISPDNWSGEINDWPDYPTVVTNEEDAVIFSQSWDDWLLAAGKC